MKKLLILGVAAGGVLLAGAAQARVAWSIGIDVPGVATVVSNQPVYRAVPPVVYAPAPAYAPARVYVAPPPVRYAPAPTVYEAPPRYYLPAPVVVVEPGYRRGDWGWRRWHEERWERDHGREDGRR